LDPIFRFLRGIVNTVFWDYSAGFAGIEYVERLPLPPDSGGHAKHVPCHEKCRMHKSVSKPFLRSAKKTLYCAFKGLVTFLPFAVLKTLARSASEESNVIKTICPRQRFGLVCAGF
jgi:hypothetical protein